MQKQIHTQTQPNKAIQREQVVKGAKQVVEGARWRQWLQGSPDRCLRWLAMSTGHYGVSRGNACYQHIYEE